MYDALPNSEEAVLLVDRGYDSDEYRAALLAKCIVACIPPRKNRKHPAIYDKVQYKQRHKVENMFIRFKDCRRIATRYDRNAEVYMAAITIAAIVIWWI